MIWPSDTHSKLNDLIAIKRSQDIEKRDRGRTRHSRELLTKIPLYDKFRRYLEDAILYSFNTKQKYQSGIVKSIEDYSIIIVNAVLPLFKAFWPQLMGCGLIAFVASGDPKRRGYVIALGMAICALLESMLNGQYEFWINVTSMRMRAALISLKLSSAGRKDFTAGEIVNIMAVDTQRVPSFHFLYSIYSEYLLHFFLWSFTLIFSRLFQFIISIKRINKYLQGDEIDPETIQHEPNPHTPVVLRNGTFSWSKNDSSVLNGITLDIKDKSLVAIVGQVGSGKSSLLSALLGDLYKTEGYVNVYGKIAYVPQSAWIQNATVRQNITFSQPYIEEKYNKVLEACALTQDLKILTGGDLTEIGEKGINLSGGQKQRVSLARAVYANSDIYFLDDPLSAVDAHVSRHLFDKVIGPTGMLKKKTRILVTHRVTFLPQVDEIIVLKDGQITEQGTYHELLAKNGEFAQFLLQFVSEQHEELAEEDKEIIEQLKEKMGPEFEKRGSIVRSETLSNSSDGIRRRTMSNASRPSTKKGNTSRSMSQLREEPESTKGNGEKFKLVETEVAQTGKVKWGVYWEFFKACGLVSCLLVILAFCLSSTFNLLSSLWLTEWSNDSLNPAAANDTTLRNIRLGVYFGLGLSETTFTLTNSIILNFAILKGARLIHEKMLHRMFRATMSFYDTTHGYTSRPCSIFWKLQT
uniref:ABC transporter domain-containing protein n=1 Tax=Tetranychus urticae TaxID=32264 RepID=T1K6E5_TETUR